MFLLVLVFIKCLWELICCLAIITTTSIEMDLTNHCISQQFPHVTEEYLNMYSHSGFSLNPLTLGLDSLHCPFYHSFWDMISQIVICYLCEEFLVPPVSKLSLKYSFCFSVGSPPPLSLCLPGCEQFCLSL